ncbi:MAG: helix-turn-helix domain-containing protein [Phycisphaeraceae bacterium]|nr:helix-turn-helix domain-containing protein [Phycisphaeraceae bacterium]
MPTESSDFRTRLKNLREGSALSQGDAATRIGASGGQWGNWERGISRPSIDELVKICVAFDVSAHWLLMGEGPQSATALALSVEVGGAAASDLAGLLETMSSDQLADLARRKADAEDAYLRGPLLEAMQRVREAVERGDATWERARAVIASIEKQIENEARVPAQRLTIVEPPVQREGYYEQVHREVDVYPDQPATEASQPNRRAKGGGK